MNRRDLLKGLVAAPLLAGTVFGKKEHRELSKEKIIKPSRLSKGDTIGIIAPSSGLSQESFDKAVQNLEGFGFKTKVGRNARGRLALFSGTDRERLDDLHWAFSDPEIKAVWCVRGGDGAPRILPDIDYRLIKKNPKIFIGYSDITALHLAIFENTGLVTFHGPVASSSFTDYTKEHVFKTLMNPTSPDKIMPSEFNRSQASEFYKIAVIKAGKARGKLIGGNLSLLAALAGTPFALKDLRGKILFVEDVNEPPYKIDRMFTQLRQSADMKSLAGIALGIFEDSTPQEKQSSQLLLEVLNDRLGDLGVPVIYGLSFGHIREQFTIPVGVEAELDTSDASITLLEAAVS